MYGLPGQWNLTLNDAFYLSENMVVLRVEQRLPRATTKIAGWVQVTPELLDDEPWRSGELEKLAEAALDHIFRPWRYPDRPAIPQVHLFPRVERLAAWARRARARVAGQR